MSNFTRSILYSASVLVAGLVAIFAIYSNVATTPNGANVAQISPAAGGSDLGISYDMPMDSVSSDAQSLIGPASNGVSDAMNNAVDQIDSTINEFEAIESSTDEDKGSSYYDEKQSFKLASDISSVEQELREKLDKEVLGQQFDGIVDQAVEQGKDEAGSTDTSWYEGQRWIEYGCWVHSGDSDEWGTCRRRSTFEEDMEYNKAIIKASTKGTIDKGINGAIGTAETPITGAKQSDISNSIDGATSDALNKIDDSSVRSQVEEAIAEERKKRGY